MAGLLQELELIAELQAKAEKQYPRLHREEDREEYLAAVIDVAAAEIKELRAQVEALTEEADPEKPSENSVPLAPYVLTKRPRATVAKAVYDAQTTECLIKAGVIKCLVNEIQRSIINGVHDSSFPLVDRPGHRNSLIDLVIEERGKTMAITEETELVRTELEDEDTVKTMSQEDWLAQGRKLFGDDPRKWKFKCACCGHVQTIGDFIELRNLGLWDGDAQVAYCSCIGRYDPRIPEKQLGKLDGEGKSPCDYTLGGLISLAKTVVVDDEGNKHKVFEFATE